MPLIFISHSSRDNGYAIRIFEWLKSKKFDSIFLDIDKHSGIAPGKHWESTLYHQVERAQAVILIITPNWLTSKWCFVEFTRARDLGKPTFPVIMSDECGAECVISQDIQHLDITSDFEAGLEKLEAELRNVALESQGGFDWDSGRPPFPGFLAFDEADAAIFFGRDSDIRRVMEHLNARRTQGGSRFTTIVAPSGAGKSSLMRAGVIPRLKRDPERWIVLPVFRPLAHPMDELAKSLAIGLKKPDRRELIRDQLGADDLEPFFERTAHELQTAMAANNAQILLPIDQLEELFTVSAPSEVSRFLRALIAATGDQARFMALTTMRVDFLGTLQQARGRSDRFAEIPLDPFPLERVGQVIRGPAKVANLLVDEDMIDAAEADVRAGGAEGALPLLAFTLEKLYQARGEENRLTLRKYLSLGDPKAELSPLENSVRLVADQVLKEAKPRESELNALRAAFSHHMVRVDDSGAYVRRRAIWSRVPEEAKELLSALRDARLLIIAGADGERSVEVAHEALLNKWPILKTWLDEQRDFLAGKHLFEKLHEEYRQLPAPRKPEAFLRGVQLTRAASWQETHAEGLSLDEKEFIRISVEADEADQRNRRRAARLIAWGTTAAAVTFAALSGLAGWQWSVSEDRLALSNHNLGAALLTRAEQALQEHMPAAAYLAAGVAIGAIRPPGGPEAVSMLDTDSEEFVRARTLAQISGPASLFPTSVAPTDDALRAVDVGRNGEIATGGVDGQIIIWGGDGSPSIRLGRHRDTVSAVRFSPAGDIVASAGWDGSVMLWSLEQRRAKALCGHEGKVRDVDFHPSGRLLATVGGDGRLIVWDAENAAKVHDPGRTAGGWILSVDFSSDGSLLAYSQQNGEIVVISSDDWREVWRIKSPERDIISIAFSADGGKIAAVGIDGALRVWNLADETQFGPKVEHPAKIWKVRFSTDGRFIATAAWDGAVRLWGAETLELAATIDGHEGWVNDLAFDPSEAGRVATVSEDKRLRTWSAAEPSPMFRAYRDHTQTVMSARFSTDGALFATGGRDNFARLYALSSDGRLRHKCQVPHRHWVIGLALSPDGALAASAAFEEGRSDNVIKLWRTSNCKVVDEIPVTSKLSGLTVHFDARGEGVLWGAADGVVRVWNLKERREQRALPISIGAVASLAVSPIGDLVAVAGGDHRIRIWSEKDGGVKHILDGHKKEIWQVRFDPSGKYLLSGGLEHELYVWNVEKGALETKLPLTSSLGGMVATPEAQRVIVTDDNQQTVIFSKPDWRREFRLKTLIGVRGPYDIQPNTDLVAFDGDEGKVIFLRLGEGGYFPERVLPFKLEGTELTLNAQDAHASEMARILDVTGEFCPALK